MGDETATSPDTFTADVVFTADLDAVREALGYDSLNIYGVSYGTRVAMHGSAEAGGFFKLAEGMVGRQFLKQMNSDFEALKQLLESE